MLIALLDTILPLLLLLALLALLWRLQVARMEAAERRLEQIDDPVAAMAMLEDATKEEKEIGDRIRRWDGRGQW